MKTKYFISQSGQSLLSTLMTASLVAGIGLSTAVVLTNAKKGEQGLSRNLAFIDFSNTMRMALSNPLSCTHAVLSSAGSLTFGVNPDGTLTSNFDHLSLGTTTVAQRNLIRDGMKFTELSLSEIDSGLRSNDGSQTRFAVYLNITAEKQGPVSGTKEVSKKFPFFITSDNTTHQVTSCGVDTGGGGDSSPPKPVVYFGGFYSHGSYVNGGTGALSCPQGYAATRVYGSDESPGDMPIFVCTRPGNYTGTPQVLKYYDFGGMFGSEYLNPITGTIGCPSVTAGEPPYRYSQVLGDNNIDYDLYYCWRETINPQVTSLYEFGGAWGYQVVGYPNYVRYPNPATGVANCPPGFTERATFGHYAVDWPFNFCYRPWPR